MKILIRIALFLTIFNLYAKEQGKIYWLGFAKAKVSDPISLQARGIEALDFISKSLEGKKINKTTLSYKVQTPKEFLKSPEEPLSIKILTKNFEELSKNVGPEDTVIIYSHTHGYRSNKTMPSGIGVELPKFSKRERGVLPWSEYSDMVLGLPAKNVIILTMSCFSGEFINYLNTPEVKKKWTKRKDEGRNFIVISSTDEKHVSSAVQIDGREINPFTNAVLHFFEHKKNMALEKVISSIIEDTKKYNIKSKGAYPLFTGSYS